VRYRRRFPPWYRPSRDQSPGEIFGPLAHGQDRDAVEGFHPISNRLRIPSARFTVHEFRDNQVERIYGVAPPTARDLLAGGLHWWLRLLMVAPGLVGNDPITCFRPPDRGISGLFALFPRPVP